MKKGIKKVFALGLVVVMAMSLAACTSGETKKETTKESDTKKSDNKKIGVAMPTKDLQRWNQDGENMKKELEDAGYTVDLQFANNEIATQVSQLENMITGKCAMLVVASIDGTALSEVLDKAKAADIPVISYDRLIMNTDAVSYYATFDNQKVGEMQGQFIEEKLDLKNQAGPFNIELFTGAPDDNNCNFFFGGAMSVLEPYIKEGKLVVQSKTDTTLAACATPNWSTEESQKRMENLVAKSYSGDVKLDAVLSSNDSVANGITNALAAAGYTADNFPILTGQDCDITSVQNILKGTQSMSVFKDTRELASKVVGMVDALMTGGEPEVNDTETYDNGKGIVPTFLCDPIVVTKDNYKEIVVESGYYTEDQLK